jgi:hypothetical protein
LGDQKRNPRREDDPQPLVKILCQAASNAKLDAGVREFVMAMRTASRICERRAMAMATRVIGLP